MDIKFFEKRNRVRNYLHFDKKLPAVTLFTYISKPENIAKHSFFPMISYVLKNKKINRHNKNLRKKLGSIPLRKEHDFSEKERLINFPSHIDGNIYAYYSKLLEKSYEPFLLENNIEKNIIAFRRITRKKMDGTSYSLCNIHFADDIFSYIERKKNCLVLCLDISAFFDNLDHSILKNMWLKVINENSLPIDQYKVYKSLCNYAYVDKIELYQNLNLSLNSRTLHKRLDRLCDINQFKEKVRKKGLIQKNLDKKGIPQGSPISGILSNIYMIDFDVNISNFFKKIDGKYSRYCDDMVFIFEETQFENIYQIIKDELAKLNLQINDKKTQKILFQNGVLIPKSRIDFNNPAKLQYLGLEYDGRKVLLRQTGVSNFHRKLRKSIRMNTTHYKKMKKLGLAENSSINKKTLHARYTYIGKRNYVSYALRASNILKSKDIRKQVKRHFKIFNQYLNKKLN